ncbi:TetR/AcrR family transcriptional regulator [Nocardia sp. NPDC059239]|uniref:TetR/AcrR family transcriptional regulator n=1 Tax=unclassified Nocardia TaxID=2637762 RepID=UPI003694D864
MAGTDSFVAIRGQRSRQGIERFVQETLPGPGDLRLDTATALWLIPTRFGGIRMAAGPRARLITNIISTVQEHGVHGVALTDLFEQSNTSPDALYHHFPFGKGQLVEIAAKSISRIGYSHVSRLADTLATAASLEDWLDELFAFWRFPLESTDYRAGSFMMAAAVDGLDPDVQFAAGRSFAEWTARLADGLIAAGIEQTKACSLAGFLLSSIEGAVVQSRALKSSHPFDDSRTQLADLIRYHLATR